MKYLSVTVVTSVSVCVSVCRGEEEVHVAKNNKINLF